MCTPREVGTPRRAEGITLMELRRPVPHRLEVVLSQSAGEVLAFLAMIVVIALAVTSAAPAQDRLRVGLGIFGLGAAW